MFPRLKLFLEQYFVKYNTQEQFKKEEIRDVIYIPNNKRLRKDCHNNLKLCVLGLLDGRPNKKSIEAFDRHMITLEKVANKKLSKNYEFGWINATCQTGFASFFNADIENLPGLVVLLPNVKKYAVFYGSFEEQNIDMFLERILKGKIYLEEFDNEKIYLRNAINCLEISETTEFEIDDEEDELIAEIRKEQQEKREKFERDRQEILNKGRKSSANKNEL